jgi:hypothetical protein
MHQILKVVLDFGAADRLGLQGSGRIKLITGDDTLYMIVLVAKYYIIVRLDFLPADSPTRRLKILDNHTLMNCCWESELEQVQV